MKPFSLAMFLLLLIFTFLILPANTLPIQPDNPTVWTDYLASRNIPDHQLTLREGLTLDPCTTTDDCEDERQCILDGSGPCPPGATACACVPPIADFCDSDEDCEDGEKCFTFEGEIDKICVSDSFAGDGSQSPPDASPNPAPPVVPAPSPGPDGGGQTLDDCTSDDDCEDGRMCAGQGSSTCTTGPCVCIPSEPVDCDSSDDCESGEICVDGVVDGQLTCVSEEAVQEFPPVDPSVSPEEVSDVEENDGDDNNENPICVDARALSHLSMEELVFEEHNWATVLCDEHESCATPGHIVTFGGKAMMMSSYCQLVGGCIKTRILVNSPRYRRGLRVNSSTEGLLFTAFAARYNTRAEEVVLVSAVHIGL